MRGLFVVGTGPQTGARGVAAALLASADAADSGTATVAATNDPDALARPAIVAVHAGKQLEPERLLDEIRAEASDERLLIVSTAGGLLAPLTERYSNRDLAAELKLPLVVATPGASGLMNATLLTIEAARGAGLAVAAVVITRWPDQPTRTVLDERAMLERRISAPVVQEPSSSWPILEWAAATTAASGDAEPPPVTLDTYDAWQERAVGDPRQTPRAEIMKAIMEIVAAEGPMRASRAYALYNRASGGRKLTSVARAPLSSAVYWLAQERRLVLTRRDDIPWQDDDLVRLPDTPPIRVRELGPRTLEEVPLDEIAELAKRLSAARRTTEATELKRAILQTYGLVRLTTRADEYLGLALDLADL
jgi:dethiobiotin synthetase